VAVIGDVNTCIGAARSDHDLKGLEGHRLRTHGARTEASVPFIVSEPISDAYLRRARAGGLKSHFIFDFAVNGAAVH
jgi:phosphonoacetate hydrolase